MRDSARPETGDVDDEQGQDGQQVAIAKIVGAEEQADEQKQRWQQEDQISHARYV